MAKDTPPAAPLQSNAPPLKRSEHSDRDLQPGDEELIARHLEHLQQQGQLEQQQQAILNNPKLRAAAAAAVGLTGAAVAAGPKQHVARLHGRIPSSKNLARGHGSSSRLSSRRPSSRPSSRPTSRAASPIREAHHQLQSASYSGEGGGGGTAAGPGALHRRSTSDIPRDSPSTELKKNESSSTLKKNKSSTDVKPNKSSSDLKRTSSNKSVNDLKLGGKHQVHFDLGTGEDDADQNEDDEDEGEWVDASSSASPILSRGGTTNSSRADSGRNSQVGSLTRIQGAAAAASTIDEARRVAQQARPVSQELRRSGSGQGKEKEKAQRPSSQELRRSGSGQGAEREKAAAPAEQRRQPQLAPSHPADRAETRTERRVTTPTSPRPQPADSNNNNNKAEDMASSAMQPTPQRRASGQVQSQRQPTFPSDQDDVVTLSGTPPSQALHQQQQQRAPAALQRVDISALPFNQQLLRRTGTGGTTLVDSPSSGQGDSQPDELVSRFIGAPALPGEGSTLSTQMSSQPALLNNDSAGMGSPGYYGQDHATGAGQNAANTGARRRSRLGVAADGTVEGAAAGGPSNNNNNLGGTGGGAAPMTTTMANLARRPRSTGDLQHQDEPRVPLPQDGPAAMQHGRLVLGHDGSVRSAHSGDDNTAVRKQAAGQQQPQLQQYLQQHQQAVGEGGGVATGGSGSGGFGDSRIQLKLNLARDHPEDEDNRIVSAARLAGVAGSGASGAGAAASAGGGGATLSGGVMGSGGNGLGGVGGVLQPGAVTGGGGHHHVVNPQDYYYSRGPPPLSDGSYYYYGAQGQGGNPGTGGPNGPEADLQRRRGAQAHTQQQLLHPGAALGAYGSFDQAGAAQNAQAQAQAQAHAHAAHAAYLATHQQQQMQDQQDEYAQQGAGRYHQQPRGYMTTVIESYKGASPLYGGDSGGLGGLGGIPIGIGVGMSAGGGNGDAGGMGMGSSTAEMMGLGGGNIMGGMGGAGGYGLAGGLLSGSAAAVAAAAAQKKKSSSSDGGGGESSRAKSRRDPRITRELEGGGMEYLVVRRYQNPVARSAARLREDDRGKGRRIVVNGATAPGSSSAGAGAKGSVEGAGSAPRAHQSFVHQQQQQGGGAARRPTTPHQLQAPNGTGSTSSRLRMAAHQHQQQQHLLRRHTGGGSAAAAAARGFEPGDEADDDDDDEDDDSADDPRSAGFHSAAPPRRVAPRSAHFQLGSSSSSGRGGRGGLLAGAAEGSSAAAGGSLGGAYIGEDDAEDGDDDDDATAAVIRGLWDKNLDLSASQD